MPTLAAIASRVRPLSAASLRTSLAFNRPVSARPLRLGLGDPLALTFQHQFTLELRN